MKPQDRRRGHPVSRPCPVNARDPAEVRAETVSYRRANREGTGQPRRSLSESSSAISATGALRFTLLRSLGMSLSARWARRSSPSSRVGNDLPSRFAGRQRGEWPNLPPVRNYALGLTAKQTGKWRRFSCAIIGYSMKVEMKCSTTRCMPRNRTWEHSQVVIINLDKQGGLFLVAGTGFAPMTFRFMSLTSPEEGCSAPSSPGAERPE